MTRSTILPVTSPNVHCLKKSPANWMTNLQRSNASQLKCLAVLSCDLSLIIIHISDCCQFSDIHISQGSVASYLRYAGIFKHDFVANLPFSLSAKEVWKYVNIWGSYGQEFSVLFFLTHCVVTVAVFKSRLKTFLFSWAFSLHSSRYHTAWPQRLWNYDLMALYKSGARFTKYLT